MKGSIRIIVGFLVVFGACGGMDNATDAQLIPLMVVAGLGLYAMYSGVNAQKVLVFNCKLLHNSYILN